MRPLKPNLLPNFKYFLIVFEDLDFYFQAYKNLYPQEMGQIEKNLKFFEVKKKSRYRNWTMFLVPDTETWFWLYTRYPWCRRLLRPVGQKAEVPKWQPDLQNCFSFFTCTLCIRVVTFFVYIYH